MCSIYLKFARHRISVKSLYLNSLAYFQNDGFFPWDYIVDFPIIHKTREISEILQSVRKTVVCQSTGIKSNSHNRIDSSDFTSTWQQLCKERNSFHCSAILVFSAENTDNTHNLRALKTKSNDR